jgi:hypothetical protein
MSIDVSIAQVYLAPPRFLVKSSSGKPSRKANKERVGLLIRETTEEVVGSQGASAWSVKN